MENALIEFQNVTKRFNTRTVLDRINLTINEGDVTTIIGKSGTGKSVLLKHIIGLLSPTEGRILFRGKPVDGMNKREWKAYKSQFSYLFQDNALFDSLTVYENIALPLQQTTNLSKKEIESKVMARIEQMDLLEATNKYSAELSGGMEKRVALARALITDPKIVLFDEPTTGQDPIRKNAILSMIVQNQKRFGFTTVMISHDIPDVFFISDRIMILYEGRMIFQDTYDQLDQLDHPIVDEFVKSLEGFKDELTGLHSKGNFQRLYEQDSRQKRAARSLCCPYIYPGGSGRVERECGAYCRTRGRSIPRNLCEQALWGFWHLHTTGEGSGRHNPTLNRDQRSGANAGRFFKGPSRERLGSHPGRYPVGFQF